MARQGSDEYPILFDCEGDALAGIVHPGDETASFGVVVVVGGPQYRAGSHRQFVLLARRLAGAGIPVLRFDLRGMGDSGGDFPGFESIDADIRTAVDALVERIPSIRHVGLWGLCDGASAIAFYAASDPRIAGVALLNPWVRTEATHAQARIRHYYGARLFSGAFWKRLAGGEVDVAGAVRGLFGSVRQARASASTGSERDVSLPDRMREGLMAFRGRILILLSGNDLTAREFADVAAASPEWRGLLEEPRTERVDLPDADHTLSRSDWSDAAANCTASWCTAIAADGGES